MNQLREVFITALYVFIALGLAVTVELTLKALGAN
jgi:hypothetical protein